METHKQTGREGARNWSYNPYTVTKCKKGRGGGGELRGALQYGRVVPAAQREANMWGAVADIAGKGAGFAGQGLSRAVEAASYVGEVRRVLLT